jgi:hypothetical protein
MKIQNPEIAHCHYCGTVIFKHTSQQHEISALFYPITNKALK